MQMHLAQFLIYGPTHHSLATWKHPRTDRSLDWTRPELYQHIAQVCERGKFDMVFFADFNIIFDFYQRSLAPALRHAVQVPAHDPLPLISWAAAATKKIGLGVTLGTSQHHPFYLARLFASLDHLCSGRVGWNVVTTVNRHESFAGVEQVRAHDERYEQAEEMLDVCYKLWRTWDDDAVVMDVDNGVFAEPDRVRTIDHQGKYYNSRGPLNVVRSPQTGPAIIQAGASPRGMAFAAKHAEAIFAIEPKVSGARQYCDDLEQAFSRQGRDRGACKVLFGVQPFIGDSEADAREQQVMHNELVPEAGAMAILSGHMGRDISQFDLDAPLPDFQTGGSQGIVDMYRRERETPSSVREIAMRHGQSVGLPQIVGTPEQVANQLEAFQVQSGGDGFMISAAYTPGAIEDFVDKVVPILQSRGLFRKDYAGDTLQEHLRDGGRA